MVTISDDDGPTPVVTSTSTSDNAGATERKWCPEGPAPETSTPKKPAMEESAPGWEWSFPSGVREEHLHSMRYETYSADYEWVHEVQASLLGLPPGTKPTESDFNNSPRYVPQLAASDKEVPEIVASH